MEEALIRFEEILATASSRIAAEYFQLPVADADSVYRERVYCYELYHQMRSIWGEFPFSLGGEIDKNGHPHFQEGPHALAKPDFLVHVPGNMDRNLACVEVKPSIRPVEQFIADLQKLTWFCRNAYYYRGIFLAYGQAGQDAGGQGLRDKLRRAMPNAPDLDMGRIHVFFHSAALRRCEKIAV
jgi:hypothetical protein